MLHRTAALAAGICLVALGPAGAAELTKVWETGGFKAPESAAYDPTANMLYVSNINGAPDAKDGNGFVSKLAPDGKLVELEWVKGLDAPKGTALAGGTLYVADIDKLVAIDTKKGEIVRRYEAPGAKFLNDVTADADGRVYVSDMVGNAIWRLADGKLTLWLQDEALENPNGLLAEDGRVLVASWGKMTDGFKTKVPGHVKVVDVASKKVSDLGDPTPVGNLDGIAPDGKGGYTVTDWVAGAIFRVGPDGKARQLLDVNQGSADHTFLAKDRLLVLPMAVDNEVVAYRLE